MATQNTQFSFITWLELRQQFAARLNDPSGIFWSDAENKLYLTESLRFLNVLTQYWTQDYTLTLNPPLASNWVFTNSGASPRAQTLTESNLYAIMLYHLMEPQLSAGTWTGTNQFTVDDLETAAQTTRDEILQQTACNMEVLTGIEVTPGTFRTYLPDNILDLRRVRYLGVDGTTMTLVKGDSDSFLRFTPSYRQTFATPTRYDILGSPPLALTVDFPPNQSNEFELLAMHAGNTLSPVTPQPLQIPNDWLFILKYGALCDLLNKEPESIDHQRADYCKKRYDEGIKLAQAMPWIENAFLNEVAVDIVPVIGKDRYSPNWQTNASTWPCVVIGGTDLIAPAPIPTSGSLAVKVTVIGNAPIPVADGDFVQAPRDAIDSIIDYAQHLAAFKQGGDEFLETMPLYRAFIDYCVSTSLRLRQSGIFASDLRPSVSRQELSEPRFAVK